MPSPKTHTTVYLSGIEFKLSASESEEYLQKLAVFVNRRIDEMQRQFPAVSISDCALLAMFDLANDYHILKDSYEKLDSRIGTLRETRTRMEHERTRAQAQAQTQAQAQQVSVQPQAPVKRPFEREKATVE